MTKTNYALTIKTVLLRPLFLFTFVLTLLLLPGLAFAESADTPAADDSSAQAQAESNGETFTAETFDSSPVVDQGPAVDLGSIASNETDEGAAANNQDPPCDLDEDAPAEQNDFESSFNPDCGSSAQDAFDNPTGTPLYFIVEQVSMSPLLQPGNIIELASTDYAEGDLVVAQLASGAYVVKVLDGDMLVPLGAGVSYSAAEVTILGKAALSPLTAADLETGGLAWSSVLAETAVAPSLEDLTKPNSATNPYLIDTLEKLYWIAAADGTKINEVEIPGRDYRWAAHYKQIINIDATATKDWFSGAGWSPIGIGVIDEDPANPFTGTYDGGGYTISGLFIDRYTTDYIDLFGLVSDSAVIKNINLVGVDITGFYFVGGLVGHNNGGTITGCFAGGDVEGVHIVGGLVGYNNKKSGTIKSCYVEGNVYGKNNIGGLVGINEDGTVENCYVTGNVTHTGGPGYFGGLVGINAGGTINKCYAKGDVDGTEFVGGLVGSNWGSIENSYATGTVTGTHYVGGLAGDNGWENNSPFITGSITNSYATGLVSGNSNVGGLVGIHGKGTITNSFYDTQTTGQNDNGKGIPKTTSEMKTLNSFTTAGWNISGVDGSYPVLSWQVNWTAHTWYMGTPSEDGPDGGFAFDGFSFTLPQLPLTSTVLTNISIQSANAIITPAFVTGGSTADLNRAISVYNQAKQSFDANKGSMSAAEKAVTEVELAVAYAAIKSLELRLAAQNGQAVDIATLVSAYQAAQAALNSNRGLLAADQVAAAQALLNAIASVIDSLRV